MRKVGVAHKRADAKAAEEFYRRTFAEPALDVNGTIHAAQSRLLAESWPEQAPLAVRFAVHTGEAVERDGLGSGR